MLNLIIFFVTTLIILFIWNDLRKEKSTSFGQMFLALILIFVLFAPLSINGNVYTILGNGVAEKTFFLFCHFIKKLKMAMQFKF